MPMSIDPGSIMTPIFSNVVAPATSATINAPRGEKLLHSKLTGSGLVAANVVWYGTTFADGSGSEIIAIHGLSSSTGSDHVFTNITELWPYIYAVITTLSGTSAIVNCNMVS